MRRIVLGGGDLDRFVWPGPASHLKLMLPLPGQDAPALPTPGPDGLVTFDRSGMTMRTYTPRAWDDERRELTIDVFLHGEGPASTWARQVEAGGQVAVSSPRATWQPDPGAGWVVLAGDETAAPAIGTLVESSADLGVRPTVVIESAGDDHDLGLPEGTNPHFVTADPDAPGRALLEALTHTVPPGDGQVWVAGEARGVRAIRAWLQGERGLPGTATVTRGYWKAGAVDHPDHDFGQD
jgi:NADPH-dependent ferric siderophore reductase